MRTVKGSIPPKKLNGDRWCIPFCRRSRVGVTRFELATPRPPDVCSNRTELHPADTIVHTAAAKVMIILKIAYRQGGFRCPNMDGVFAKVQATVLYISDF